MDMDEIRKTILVPFDFTSLSDYALGQAVYMAEIESLDIVLFHNVSTSNTGFFKKKISYNTTDIQKKLDNIAIANKTEKIFIGTCIKTGITEKTMAKAVDEFKSKYIIFGREQTEDSEYNKETASQLLRISKATKTPLFSINKKRRHTNLKKIVLPIDNTSETMQKVLQTIELAKTYRSKLYLFAPFFDLELDEYNKQKIHFNQVKKTINKNRIPSSSKTISLRSDEKQKISELLLDYVNEVSADVVVIMTNQETNSEKPEEIIINSEIPVLSICSKRMNKLSSFG